MNNFWTDEKIQILKKLLSEGELSFNQIAARIGKSRSATIGKAKRLGLKTPPSRQKTKGGGYRGGARVPAKPREYPRIQPSAPAPAIKSPVEQLFNEPAPRPTKARVRLPPEFDDDAYFYRWIAKLGPATSRYDITKIPSARCCKWISGGVKEKKATWCGKEAVTGTSWCRTHLARVYIGIDQYTGRVPKSAMLRLEDRKVGK